LIGLIEGSYVRESTGLATRNLQISFLNEPLDASFCLEPLNTTGFHFAHQVSGVRAAICASQSSLKVELPLTASMPLGDISRS
jgi:hypothetical protein